MRGTLALPGRGGSQISVVPERILLVPRVKNPIKVLEEEGKSYRKT